MNKGLNLFWSTILAVTMVSFFFSITSVAQAAGLSVETSAICEDVVDREPVDEGTSFSVSVGRLYYFTKIVGAESGGLVLWNEPALCCPLAAAAGVLTVQRFSRPMK
jgi:hypothetical protein